MVLKKAFHYYLFTVTIIIFILIIVFIITQGTGDGEYTVEVSQIKEFDDGARSRTISSQTGNAISGNQESLTLSFEDGDFENETFYSSETSTNTSTKD